MDSAGSMTALCVCKYIISCGINVEKKDLPRRISYYITSHWKLKCHLSSLAYIKKYQVFALKSRMTFSYYVIGPPTHSVGASIVLLSVVCRRL